MLQAGEIVKAQKPIMVRPEEFKKMLDHDEVLFLLDLRSEDEFEGWRIEGRTSVETLHIPHEDFTGEEEKLLALLPDDREIITVCTHGGLSRHIAGLLRENGFYAQALEGGMERWSEFYETRKVHANPDIYQIYRVAKGCITHVIISGNKAVVIDAVRHIEHIENILAVTGARLACVFETHLQSDHLSGGRELAMKYDVPYHINSADVMEAHYNHAPLPDGQEFRIGYNSLLTALHSPGHTVGSTSLILDGKFIFAGDTLMPSSAGRPDLPGMVSLWADLLYSTLHERFDNLPDELVILPSHAAGIHEQDGDGIVRLTLGEARKRLPLMGIADRAQFIEFVEDTLPENPESYRDIRKVNLGFMDADEQKRKEIETGKNLCGIAEALQDQPVTASAPATLMPDPFELAEDIPLQNSSETPPVIKPADTMDTIPEAQTSVEAGTGVAPAVETEEDTTLNIPTGGEAAGEIVENRPEGAGVEDITFDMSDGGDEAVEAAPEEPGEDETFNLVEAAIEVFEDEPLDRPRMMQQSEEVAFKEVEPRDEVQAMKAAGPVETAEEPGKVEAVQEAAPMEEVQADVPKPEPAEVVESTAPEPEPAEVSGPAAPEPEPVRTMAKAPLRSEPHPAVHPDQALAALPGWEEMREIFGELAAERFDEMTASVDLKAMLLDTMTPTIREYAAKILWESTPEITEKLLKDAVKSSFDTLNEKLESVIWGTMPELAETIIRKEIKKIKAEDEH